MMEHDDCPWDTLRTHRTTENTQSRRRSVVVAALAANLLVLALTLTHRALAARFAASATTVPIAPEVLERLPMQIGDWIGEDVPLDEEIVRRTDSDSLISRRYARLGGREAVNVYITCGVNASELLRHSPENCYSGAGWLLASRRSAELTTANGTMLPCTIYEFVRNGLGMEKITALLYLIVDGRHYGSVPAVKWRVWRADSAVRYGAEVQIMVPAGLSGDAVAADAVSEFAVDSFLPIVCLFDHIAKD